MSASDAYRRAEASVKQWLASSRRRPSGQAQPSGRFARHHQRDVLAAEAEGVRHHVAHPGVARRVRHHVERDRRIGHLVIDGRRDALIAPASAARTPPRPRRPPTAYGRSSTCWRRSASSCSARRTRSAMPRYSILSFSGVAGAVRVDVVDVARASRPASASALRMQPMIGLPSGLERVRWKESASLAAAFEHAEDLGAARLRRVAGFPAPARRRLRPSRSRRGSWRTASSAACGVIVLRRQRRQQREADQRFRR